VLRGMEDVKVCNDRKESNRKRQLEDHGPHKLSTALSSPSSQVDRVEFIRRWGYDPNDARPAQSVWLRPPPIPPLPVPRGPPAAKPTAKRPTTSGSYGRRRVHSWRMSWTWKRGRLTIPTIVYRMLDESSQSWMHSSREDGSTPSDKPMRAQKPTIKLCTQVIC